MDLPETTVRYRALIQGVMTLAVEHSSGRLRLAFNEADMSIGRDVEAAHFLKLDEKRLGRDLELYAFMMEMMGPLPALLDLLAEVLIPLRSAGLDRSYIHAGGKLKTDGLEFVPAPRVKGWNDLFA